MTAIPAFCSNCNSFFVNSSVFGSGMIVTVKNSSINCPFCNADAKFIDGTYTGDIINIILNSGIDASDYKKFSQIVEASKNKPISVEQVSERIKSEVPKLSPLTAFLKYDFGLIPILNLMGMIIGIYIGLLGLNKPEQITPAKIVNKMQNTKTTLPINTERNRKGKTKIGINEPCICGSGKKYKKCCQSKR